MVNQPVSGTDIFESMAGRGNIIEAGSVPRQSKEVQYWKKCAGCNYHSRDFGFVTTGPVMSPRTAVEYTEFMNNKHATPLPQYGHYIVGKVANQKYNLSDGATRYQAIIELGGIHEFPIEQMVEMNWHRFPIMVEVEPRLATIKDVRCEHGCVNRLFNSDEGYQAHINVMHRDVAQSESIGRNLERAMSMNNGNATLDEATITRIGIAIAQAMKLSATPTTP